MRCSGLDYSPRSPGSRAARRGRWADPYDVAPRSSPSAGLQLAGLPAPRLRWSYRRRDELGAAATIPISLPPLITRRLPARSTRTAASLGRESARRPCTSRSPTAIANSTNQTASGWRAAKHLVVYASRPHRASCPNTPRQVVAGLSVEKGDGVDRGPVDARWDWPRFVASLTEPEINTRLTTAMERHGLQIGDFLRQKFLLPTEPHIGGTGTIENGVLVFRALDGTELLRRSRRSVITSRASPKPRWHEPAHLADVGGGRSDHGWARLRRRRARARPTRLGCYVSRDH